jgi:hypothetical protein
MAKARKEGKPRRNRRNLVKNLRRIEKNNEVLKNLLSKDENLKL